MKTNATGVQGTARTWHQTVRVVATSNSAASGLLTVDGIALAPGDRVLLTAQSSGVDNGIYVADAGIWIRAVDMLAGATVEPTAHVPVSEGTSNADSTYQLTTDGVITVGTTSMTFAKIAGGGGGGTDPNAIHVNVADEIHGIPLKAALAEDDEIVIEDASDAWNKKRGTLGQLLIGERVVIEAKNDSGADMTKGQVVYVAGESPSGKPLVELADADGSGTMSAIGLVFADILNGAEGSIIVAGALTGVDTSAFLAGDKLYVSTTPGELTNTRPSATSELVQNIGFVTRDHATVGSIAIVGSGRSNDVPNSLTALTGVALGASDLGTFTGSIISDNTDIKTALQELETSTGPAGDANTIQFNSDPAGSFTGNSNLTYDLSSTRLLVNASDMLVTEDGDVVLYADGTAAGTQRVGVGTDAPDTKLHVIDASGGSNTKQITFGYDATNQVTLEASNTGQLAVESYDCHQFFRSTNDTCIYHYLHHSTSGTTTGSGLLLFLNGDDGGIVNQEQGDLDIRTTPAGGAKNCDGIRMAREGGSRIRLNLVEVTTSTSTLTSTDVNSIVCIDNTTPHATVTITLPDTADGTQPIKSGCWYEFKDASGNAGTYPITIQVDGGSSDTIDGAASIVLNQDYAAVRIFVHDTNKYMIGA